METVTILRLFAGVAFSLGSIAGIFYILTLYRALAKCSPASRSMLPEMVWLLLIPFFNLVWNFFVVSALAQSLAAEFRARNIPNRETHPGRSVGTAMAICATCGMIPMVNVFAGLAFATLWILYWVKMSGFSSKLDPVCCGAAQNFGFK